MKTRSASEWTLQIFEPQPGRLYNLDTTAHLTGTPRRSLLVYWKHGLIEPIVDPPYGMLYFTDESIRMIRQIEYLRLIHGINLTGVRMIFDLLGEIERLKGEMRFLRG